MFDDTKRPEHLYKDLYTRDEAPVHPGEVLREDILPALKLSKSALARALGVSRGKLDGLLKERTPVSLDLAFRLGIVLGHGARYWLGLQMQHDIWCAEQGAPASLKVKPLTRMTAPSSYKPDRGSKSRPAGAARARAGFR